MAVICGGQSGRLIVFSALVSFLVFTLIWRSGSVTKADLPSWRNTLMSSLSRPKPVQSPYIWQIRFDPDPKSEERRQKWVEMNPDSTYVFLDTTAADALIEQEFADRPDIQKTWTSLGSRILRSDYLRYLALAARGGVYADLDAIPLRPIEQWIPEEYRGRAHAAIGLEFDQRDDHGSMDGMDWPVQFCQWTMYSWAKHPLLYAMVDQVTNDIYELADQHGTSLENLQPKDSEVLRTTGPSAWTRLIFKELSRISGSEITWKNITKISEPRLFGDVLILPINAYGGGQAHSGSSSDPIPNGNVRHLFEGFWKHGWHNE